MDMAVPYLLRHPRHQRRTERQRSRNSHHAGKVVDDVLRGHHQLDRAPDRQVQRVDLALSAPMLDFPHPLLADDVDPQGLRRRLEQPNVEVRAPNENKLPPTVSIVIAAAKRSSFMIASV
jgi:hypothetical protein